MWRVANRKRQRNRSNSPSNGLSVRRTTDGRSWVLLHPRCARNRAEDLEEVQLMIKAGEADIALDELRWLLSGCAEFIAAHVLLGDLARDAGDVPLARGHYGAGYQLGMQTLRRAKMPKPLLYSQPANRAFFEAGRGLMWRSRNSASRRWPKRLLQRLPTWTPAIRFTCVRCSTSCAAAAHQSLICCQNSPPPISAQIAGGLRPPGNFARPSLRPPRIRSARQTTPVHRLQIQLAGHRRLAAVAKDAFRNISRQLARPDIG